MIRTLTILLLLAASALQGQVPSGLGYNLYAQDGTFLGHTNKYYPGSIYHRFGPHGSEFSPTSIWNKFSPHGSRFSQYSWKNPFALESPIIKRDGEYFGRLGGNQLLPDSRSLYELNNPFLIPETRGAHDYIPPYPHTTTTTTNQKKTATHPHSLIQQYQNAKTLKEKQKIWNDMFNTP